MNIKSIILILAIFCTNACAMKNDFERLKQLQREGKLPVFIIKWNGFDYLFKLDNNIHAKLISNGSNLVFERQNLLLNTVEPLSAEKLAEQYSVIITINHPESKILADSWLSGISIAPKELAERIKDNLSSEFTLKSINLFIDNLPKGVLDQDVLNNTDISLVDKYISIIKQILQNKDINDHDKKFIKLIASFLVSLPNTRSRSAKQAWISYGQAQIIQTLNSNITGQEILNNLSNINNSIKELIIAYTQVPDYLS